MSKLYEILEKYGKALDMVQIDEETGEMFNYEELDKVTGEFDEKVENIGCYIKNLTADVEALKSEEENLYARRKAKEKKIENIKNYLSSCMFALGKEVVDTTRCKVSFRKSESVEIVEEDKIPKEFMKEKITYSADKTAIKEAIKGGTIIAGCQLVEKKNIQIK